MLKKMLIGLLSGLLVIGLVGCSSNKQKCTERAQRIVDKTAVSELTLKTDLEVNYKFSKKEIEYALKNIEVDFNRECLEAANLLNEANEDDNVIMNKRLIETTLLSTGFTDEQVVYAMDRIIVYGDTTEYNAGDDSDWNEIIKEEMERWNDLSHEERMREMEEEIKANEEFNKKLEESF